ncbi:MAG: NAD(P)/FAD-dependent oxidoreductase [Chloroflexi bacterium]|nr:NAD(P)/FAD-dependent oxidoreductase [Chloroflexota bacterium]
MDESFDFVIIGAGAAGEAAAGLALTRGASVAVIDDDLIGGSCAYWACMPSKALLHAAAVHHAGGDYPWPRASDFRDYMINREGIDYPDDSAALARLTKQGGIVIRGRGRLAGPGRVEVMAKGTVGGEVRSLRAGNVIIAVGSHSKIPPTDGLAGVAYWTNREATSARELPRSLLVMGGGPTGVELTQVYARYGVPTTIVDSNDRLLSKDHPLSSRYIQRALERDGATVRTGVRAQRVTAADGADGAHRVELSDGSAVEGHEILVAVGRAFPVEDLGLESVGVSISDGSAPRPDAALRLADGVFIVGDPAGPEMHTHIAHYEGEMAVRIALGDEVTPDFRAIPRATYTDPETGSVGLLLNEAHDQGHEDAFEETADLAESAKGFVTQSEGHVSIVVDGQDGVLLGTFICGSGASEAIHEAVLAVKLRTPLHVLADTIHAFPTTARVLGGLFAKAARRL